MKNLNQIIFAIAVIGGLFLAFSFFSQYKLFIRNAAIDGCAKSSLYQAVFDENGRTITIQEPQKHLYDKCLVDKKINLDSSQ